MKSCLNLLIEELTSLRSLLYKVTNFSLYFLSTSVTLSYTTLISCLNVSVVSEID
jgi:hypothetical protein